VFLVEKINVKPDGT
jgi:serine/threonine protein kinase